MDLLSTHACLHLLADLRLASDRVSLLAPRSRLADHKPVIHFDPGWLTLIGEMLERLLLLPIEEQPRFEYIHALDGKLELGWSGDSHQADMLCVSTKARAEHVCQWCSVRGRYQEASGLTLCRSHATLVRQKKPDDITLAERLQAGRPYPKRRMLIDVVIRKRTLSGLTAALANETGEHGFEEAHAHMPAAWLTGTAGEADLYVLDAIRTGQVLDREIFDRIGVARSFHIGDALPLIMEAANLLNLTRIDIEALVEDAGQFDPEIRTPAFRRLVRILQ